MRWFVWAIALGGLLWAGLAEAHSMRTAYVEIVEHAPGQAIVRFRTTIAATVTPRFPAGCDATNLLREEAGPSAASTNPLASGGATYSLRCKGPFAGREMGVGGLGTIISEAVVWVKQSGGATSTHLLTAARPTFRIPSASSALTNFAEYVPLGVEHILRGADHLLFLLLLVLLLRRPKAVLWAETAFTVSHGLSFSAAALGWIRVSKDATEACIAASLLLLALDVERTDKGRPSANSAAALALVFGLVHGLGFAGGMQELGMPSQNVGWALLGFGAGVEVGQVIFLIGALVLLHVVSRRRFFHHLTMGLTYLAGGLAAYWFIDRVRGCFDGWNAL